MPEAFFSFVMKRFSTNLGLSAREARAHMNQQFPKIPYFISFGSISS